MNQNLLIRRFSRRHPFFASHAERSATLCGATLSGGGDLAQYGLSVKDRGQ